MPSGPFLVSRTGDVGWTKHLVKVPNITLMRYHKRCWLIKTAGRWTWKSSSAKECVTTHLPNQPALKMDGAVAWDLYRIGIVSLLASKRYRVGGCRGCWEATGVRQSGAATGTDLGSSSNYSSEILEDWSGEGFHMNRIWIWVSRS